MTAAGTVLTRRAALQILRGDTRDRGYQTDTRSGEAVAQYLAWKKMSGAAATTLDAYEFTLALMCHMFPDTPPEELDAGQLLEVIATLPVKSQRTRGKAPIADFFKWATAWKRLAFNPAVLLPDFRVPTDQIYDIFTADERASIVRAASQEFPRENRIPVRDKAGVLLFMDTGARKTDVRLLQWRDVDTAERFVIFRHRKGGKQKAIRFGETLQAALLDAFHSTYPVAPFGEAERRTPLPDDYVVYPNGFNGHMVHWLKPRTPMAESTMHRWWYAILQRAEIVAEGETSGRKLHLTRHTHGTEVYEATGDIYETAERLGHSSLETAKGYVHNSRRRGDALVDALELYHKGDS